MEVEKYTYTVVNGVDNKIIFASEDLIRDITNINGGTNVVIRIDSTPHTIGITYLGYEFRDSSGIIIKSNGPKNVMEEKGYDYTVNIPKVNDTYTLYIVAGDQNGQHVEKKYTIVVTDEEDTNQ